MRKKHGSSRTTGRVRGVREHDVSKSGRIERRPWGETGKTEIENTEDPIIESHETGQQVRGPKVRAQDEVRIAGMAEEVQSRQVREEEMTTIYLQGGP